MGLPETVLSGRRSNFSKTCSLLSRYLIEKGRFADIKFGLTSSLEPKGAPAGGVNLIAAVGNETQKKSEPDSAQMTIFYAGQVIVFDDFPADKAKQIMMLASKSSGAASQSPAESTTGIQNIVTTFGIQKQAVPTHHTALDLPIARKKSLARFLEKRKDRITANAPYQASKPAAAVPKPPAKGEAWVGMAPRDSGLKDH